MKLLLSLAIAAFLAGCASIPPNNGFDLVAERVSEAGQTAPVWPGVSISEAEVQKQVQILISKPLTEESAIELALLNNRSLRAEYFGLKAAAGEYKEQASLPNPFVSTLILEGEDGHGTNLSYGLGIEILDILFLPRRMKAAGKTFEAKQARTTEFVLDFIADVRVSYYNVVAAQQIVNLMEQANEASTASVSVARALFEAGNIARVEFDRENLLAAEILLETLKARSALASTKERFNAKLGLDNETAQSWTIQRRLRNPSREEQKLEPIDISHNLYLAATDAQIDAFGARLGLEAASSYIGEVELEFEREREGGDWANGVGVALGLPVFNWGSGARQSAGAKLEAMIHQRIADSIEIKARARRLEAELQAMHLAVTLQRRTLLPLAERVMQGVQLDYNAMQIGVFALLDAKRDQLAAGQKYVSDLRDYWILKARYDQMMAGGSIAGLQQNGATSSPNRSKRGDH